MFVDDGMAVNRSAALCLKKARWFIATFFITTQGEPPLKNLAEAHSLRGSRIRTHDLRFWRPIFYQLNYTPIHILRFTRMEYLTTQIFKSQQFFF